MERLRAVFERLRAANLKLGASKCQLAKEEVCFLGYKVTPSGLKPDPRLLKLILEAPTPTTVKEVRSFLGLIGYYRRFVENFSDKAAPLNALLHQDKDWRWTEVCQEAFEALKREIGHHPVTAYPDFKEPFRIYTQATKIGLGAVLTQKQEGIERTVCCASRTLNVAEANYSTLKKECLAVVWGLNTFRPFVIATQFEVVTDPQALHWLQSQREESALLHRWAASLEDYQFDTVSRFGDQAKNIAQQTEVTVQPGPYPASLSGRTTQDQDDRTGIGRPPVRKRPHVSVLQDEHKPGKARRVERPLEPGGTTKGINGPWEAIDITVLGPFPMLGRKQRFILSLMDVYSHYIIAIPISTPSPEEVSRCLCEEVAAYFGVPRSIFTDRGTDFESKVWQHLQDKLLMTCGVTPLYLEFNTGMVKESHSVLDEMLMAFLKNKDVRNWHILLPSAMLYLNNMIQGPTGITASEILLGRRNRLPKDMAVKFSRPVFEDQEGYVKQLKRTLAEIRKKLTGILGQEKDQKDNPFRVGDQVMVTVIPMGKSLNRPRTWQGPFTIVKIPSVDQVIYEEEGVEKLAPISYVTRWNDRPLCLTGRPARGKADPHSSRRRRPRKMGKVFFSARRGQNRTRMGFHTLNEAQKKWTIFEGKIKVTARTEGEECDKGLRRVIDLCDGAGYIGGDVLRDLWGQRSEEEGSSCDGSNVISIPDTIDFPSLDEILSPESQVRSIFINIKSCDNNGNNELERASNCNNSKGSSPHFSQGVNEGSKDLQAVVAKIRGRQRNPGEYPDINHTRSLRNSERKKEKKCFKGSYEGKKSRGFIKRRREEEENSGTREFKRPVTSRASFSTSPFSRQHTARLAECKLSNVTSLPVSLFHAEQNRPYNLSRSITKDKYLGKKRGNKSIKGFCELILLLWIAFCSGFKSLPRLKADVEREISKQMDDVTNHICINFAIKWDEILAKDRYRDKKSHRHKLFSQVGLSFRK